MPFVRRKRINGRIYLYRVENRWEGGRVRQVVLEYLGAEDPVPRKRPPGEETPKRGPAARRARRDKP